MVTFRSLEIIHGELGPKLPLLLKAVVFPLSIFRIQLCCMQKPAAACRSPTTSRQTLEKIKLRQLHLQQNELFEEGTRQVIEAHRQLPMHRCIMEAQ